MPEAGRVFLSFEVLANQLVAGLDVIGCAVGKGADSGRCGITAYAWKNGGAHHKKIFYFVGLAVAIYN